MAFKLDRPTVDLGQTAIENIFINDFMANAQGDHVKVYLLGYYLARLGDATFSNETIAQRLTMNIADVVAAWHYWQSAGIVSCIDSAITHSTHQFDVVFHSIREKYVAQDKPLPTPAQSNRLTPASKLLAALSNPHIKKMFEDIEFYARRILTAQEKSQVLNFLEHYNMETDVVVMAFYITYEERNIRINQLNYAEGIIKNWYQNGIYNLAALKQSDQFKLRHYQLLRTISRALGINQRQIPTELQNAVNDWRDVKQYDEDYILYVVKAATRRTNNPNLNYLLGIFEAIANSGGSTLEHAKRYFENRRSQTGTATKSANGKPKRTNFQNFEQRTKANLNDIIRKKNNS